MKIQKWTAIEKRRAQLHKHGIRIGRKHVGKQSEKGWYAIQRNLEDRSAERVRSGPHRDMLTAVGFGERMLVEHRQTSASALLTAK